MIWSVDLMQFIRNCLKNSTQTLGTLCLIYWSYLENAVQPQYIKYL